MTKVIITDRELHALKPEPARYERAVSKSRGLSVLVYPNGCKTFVARYVAGNGARRRLPLGDYPSLSLADARLKAGALRLELAEGRDPAAERASARAEARMGETFGDLSESYFEAAGIGLHGGRRRPLRPATIERQKALWARHLRPGWGQRRYRDIRRADVRQYMQGLVTAGDLSASSIASIGDVLRAFFTYALDQDLVEANPTVKLVRPITPESRSRMFADAAMAKVLLALADASNPAEGREDPHARMGAHMALGLRFLILTLTRRTEAAGARWPETSKPASRPGGAIGRKAPGGEDGRRRVQYRPVSGQSLGGLTGRTPIPRAFSDPSGSVKCSNYLF
jgi:hypothetical protein